MLVICLIKLNNVCKTYSGRNFSVNALKGINLHIDLGSYCSIIGKSGSGKSSLLKIIGLLDLKYNGEYSISQKNMNLNSDKELSYYRKKIGFVFQDFQLINRYTVKKNMEVASIIKFGNVNNSAIETSLDSVGMLAKSESYPDELSGGQKQRVAIARAIMAAPELLIADEPTGAVDEENTSNILTIIDEIHQMSSTTIIVVTHDIDVAKRADRVIELREGIITNDNVLL